MVQAGHLSVVEDLVNARLKGALLRAAEPSRIEEGGGAARFKGRGRARITISDLKPPAHKGA